MMPSDLFSTPKPAEKWFLRWWSVLLWLVTIGPFGLPFLWISKEFNLFWKWALTLVILLVTALCIWSTWAIIVYVIGEFKNAGLL